MSLAKCLTSIENANLNKLKKKESIFQEKSILGWDLPGDGA